MKRIITILLIIFSANCFATNHYWSATGSNANNGLSSGAPKQTIAQLNIDMAGYAANDSVLFNRGDVFYGGIIVPKANLFFDAYGTGAKPVITGLSTVTGWVSLGSNLYEASVTNVKAAVNFVLRNGKIQQVGRYPNASAANGGYLNYTSGTSTSLNGVVNSSITNWTGAEVVVRTDRWTIYHTPVTSHSSSTLSFASLGVTPRSNYGYFFQRDSRTLDQDGEWWYDAANSKLRVYLTSAPATYIYQIVTIDSLFQSNYGSTVVQNLAFNGSGMYGIYMHGNTGVTIKNCDVNNSGTNGIVGGFCYNMTVDNCTVKNTLSSGIMLNNSSPTPIKSSVTNCIVDSTALLAGMENPTGFNGCNGIINKANTAIVQYCRITNSGYIGIEWGGSDVYIKYNYINKYCSVRDDGSGIYTLQGSGSTLPYYYNRWVVSNIVTNGIGANYGTDDLTGTSVNGLYFDQGTHNVIIDSNTCAYNAGGAFHGNNNDSLYFRNNTFFGNNKTISFQRFNNAMLVRTIVFTKNILDRYRFAYRNLAIDQPKLLTKQADILAMGTIDSNYYSLRSGTDTSLFAVITYSAGTNYSQTADAFAYLTGTVGIETHSINFANTGTLYTNPTSSPVTVIFAGLSNKDHAGIVYNNSATIPAFSSIILIANGTTTPTRNYLLRSRHY